ncbi:hypothetical protein FIBSPDRAFT_849949 [Athelia psychrophila]|uniref:Uncharacterized protein n=1 Tax=Athelia psychrophila TaxID=1759441 RepID=A0A166TST9_9AGAM|nr:hypothetical protein FIBSPDRAFT_869619 [Fibularhizoctonia sp. CBS 109695]KZP30936.1 hypothetical protein FIBSPDRAFT_849949 [Fibularhizoctonia sp. CBS 109695]
MPCPSPVRFLSPPLCICIPPTLDTDASHFLAMLPSSIHYRRPHARQPQPSAHRTLSCARSVSNTCSWTNAPG